MTAPGRVPALFYSNRPIVGFDIIDLISLTAEELETFATLAGASVDPSRGHMTVTVSDCLDSVAPNVRLDLGSAADASTVFFYGSGLAATDATGRVIIANVIPGGATIAATFQETGDAVAGLTVQVRAGALTTVALRASP